MEDENSVAEPVSTEVDIQDANQTDVAVQANKFSIYVVGTSEPKTLTFNFYDENGNPIENDKQIVHSNEIVNEPSVPELEGKIFTGWFEKNATEAYIFGNVGTIAETKSVDLYAKYSAEYHVYYLDANGNTIYTQKYAENDKLDYSDVKLSVGANQSVTGWYTETAENPIENGSAVTSNITLKPIITDGYWLIFNVSDDASYVEPEFVSPTSGTTAPANPTRQGYDFAGWYEDDAYKTEYTFGGKLTADKTLYAKWNAKEVYYSVIFWTQKVTDSKTATDSDKKYDYYADASTMRQAPIGTTVSPTKADTSLKLTGFIYNSTNSKSVTVAADGTTTLNIYYDRQVMTLHFTANWIEKKCTSYTWYGECKAWTDAHYEYDQTFTGLYGSTLASNGYTWPTNYKWTYKKGDKKTTLTFLDAFINPNKSADSLELSGEDLDSGSLIEHYKQNLDGTYPSKATNSTKSSTGGTWYFSDKYNGFTVSEYSTDYGDSWTSAKAGDYISQPDSLKIHYTRNSYKLSFYNVNSESKTETVLYEDSLKQYASYTPARPNGLANYYTFDGWYTDADCQNKFNFDSEMPANDLQLYAKWVAPTFSVIFYNGSDIYQKVTGITAENTIDTIVPPTDSVKTFAGWVKEDGTPFSFAQKITSNMNIYAKWMGGKISEVSYDANGGTGTVTDKMHYYENAQAQVASADGLTAPDGKVFIGWKSSVDNAIYYPGSLIKIGTSNIIFKAQWADKAATTKLVYDFNGGIDSEGNKASVVETLLENGQVAVANYVVSRSDYVFIGWNTAKDGTGAMVQAGNKVQIDNASQFTTDTNTLFAQWVKLTHLQIEGSKKTCIYTGEIQSNNEIKVIGLPAGYTYENVAVNAASGKNVDSYKGTVDYSKIVIKDKSGNDVTNLFKIDSATAPELVITPRAVIVTANDKSKVYGTADPTLDATVAGTLGTDTVTYTTSRVAGENVGTYTITPAGEATQGNYSVTYATGTLTITKAPAEQNAVTAETYNGTYDGAAHSILNVKATQSDSTLYYTTEKPQNTVLFALFNLFGAQQEDTRTWSTTLPTWTDVTAAQTVYVKATNPNYEDSYTSATVTITKRNVTLTSGTATKVYDGTALTNDTVTISDQGFVAGQSVTYAFTGTQTEVGSSNNTFTYAVNDGTDANNYDIAIVTGTLTITARPTTPVVPDRPASPTTDDRNARPSTPNTGDQTNAPMAAGALAFSMLLAGLAFFFRRKYSD